MANCRHTAFYLDCWGIMGRIVGLFAGFCIVFCSRTLLAETQNHHFLLEQHQLNPSPSQAAARYPIILHHGLFGFKKFLFIEYFHEIPFYLRKLKYVVFASRVNPIGTIKERTEQLQAQVDMVLQLTGAKKVNIVGHSMGGLDARYLVSQMGYHDRVASISMIGTPNRGSYVADLVSRPFVGARRIRRHLLSWLGITQNPEDPSEQTLVAKAMRAINNCSERYMRGFNQRIRNRPEVLYQSWSGHTTLVRRSLNDRVSPFFALTYPILKARHGSNDGLVSEYSAKWGQYRGRIFADHIDQIGFLFNIQKRSFDHITFFEKMAANLGQKGF